MDDDSGSSFLSFCIFIIVLYNRRMRRRYIINWQACGRSVGRPACCVDVVYDECAAPEDKTGQVLENTHTKESLLREFVLYVCDAAAAATAAAAAKKSRHVSRIQGKMQERREEKQRDTEENN